MQSGITASQELQSAFNELVSSSPSQRGLIAGIKNEQLIPIETLVCKSPDFFADLDDLHTALKDNEAAFVILHRYQDAPDGFVAVTYVPDTANVRQKMLYASTKLTLVRELGTERFRETIFATTKAELTAAGWRKHDAHGELKAPLTEDEQTLQNVKEAEADASRSTASRRDLPQGQKGVPIRDEALDALRGLRENGYNLVQLTVNAQTETIDLIGTSKTELESLPQAISSEGTRYSLFRYEHTFAGETQSPVIFISSCPSGLKVKDRMLHASSRTFFLKNLTEQAGIEVDKKLEIGDPTELTPSGIHDELHPKTEQKSGFSRPKRPGRK